jgi:hypothetical protein
MRAQKCTTPGHGDRPGVWLITREGGSGAQRWACDACKNMAENYTRVFTPFGTVAHLLSNQRSASGAYAVVCGLHGVPGFGWWGTGTQDEIDKAARLRLCRNCTRYFVPTDSSGTVPTEPIPARSH